MVFVDLKTRAEIEAMYWSVCHEINALAKNLKHIPEELMNIDKLLADKYFCNFSLFQSLSDSWAIHDQLFPILPLQRLDERPSRNATLQDITCDSDGKIAALTNRHNSTPARSCLEEERALLLGCIPCGSLSGNPAGDMHSLFSDTTAVHAISVKDGHYHIDQIIDGETVAEVLEYVQYAPKKLVRQLEIWVARVSSRARSLWKSKEFLSLTTALVSTDIPILNNI